MQKSDLFELINAVKVILSEELPVIVGSQATYALTDDPPEIALESVECDFLLYGGKAEERDRINRELGVFSPYQRENGYYADALGLATVVLPSGWQDRLQPLLDSENKVVANCIEIHDVAISKIIAGREKDFEFLDDIMFSELVSPVTLIDRLEIVKSQVENDTIPDRVSKLIAALKKRNTSPLIIEAFKKFIDEIQ